MFHKLLRLAGPLLALFMLAPGLARAQPTAPLPFTVISHVAEANPRVVALSLEFGQDLPLNWKLEQAFSVKAELLPVKSYTGDLIANSAAAKAPRTIIRAYTSASAEPGSPSQGRYVIIELDPNDFNASSWYFGFNPGFRQALPYGANMVYDVQLLHDLNPVVPNVSPQQPGGTVATVKAGTAFRQAGARIATADQFKADVFRQPANNQTKAIGYSLYTPPGLPVGAKVPLVVFLHGSGQSHDTTHFANDVAADVLSPLLANQGGVAWVERAPEKAYVLVPQAPARDTADTAGEIGWRAADTQKLLLGLVDRVLADHPDIDTRRLYLTGLSLGAMGSWAIITHSDPAISRKFAAAALFNGIPIAASHLAGKAGETPAQREQRIAGVIRGTDLSRLSIPLWLGHSNTDPAVTSIGSRIPFALLSGQGRVDDGGTLHVEPAVLTSDPLVRRYKATNRAQGSDLRYTEYQYGDGSRFLDLGMVTPNGHFSWEASYKDQAIIDWMFRQARPVER
jgi:predicted peptidase